MVRVLAIAVLVTFRHFEAWSSGAHKTAGDRTCGKRGGAKRSELMCRDKSRRFSGVMNFHDH